MVYAAWSVGMFGLFRMGELLQVLKGSVSKRKRLCFEHLKWYFTARGKLKGVEIFIVNAKTSKSANQVQTVNLACNGTTMCPVTALWNMKTRREAMVRDRHLRASHPLNTGPKNLVFLLGSGQHFTLNDSNKLLKALAGGLGWPVKRCSNHCFRIGGVTDLFRAGVDMQSVGLHGRWRSDALKRYNRPGGEDLADLTSKILHQPKARHAPAFPFWLFPLDFNGEE